MSRETTADPTPFPLRPPRRSPFDPPEAEHLLRTETPIARVSLPTGGWAWLVTRHADVRELLRHPAFSCDVDRPNFPLLRALPASDERRRAGFFIRMDPPEHTRFRRTLTPEFMIRSIRRLEPLIRATVDDSLTRMVAAGPPADLIPAFALPVPSAVICHLLGVSYADHDFFQERSRTLLDWTVSPERIQTAGDELRDFLLDLVVSREREPTDDLVGRLAQRIRTGELSREEVVGMSLLLLVAGHETTTNMLGLSVLFLLAAPQRYAALRERPERTPELVEELLRYLTIVHHGLPRIALANVYLGGQFIRAGEGVIGLLSAANRDEKVFPDGERFDADRTGRSHLAFGFGAHQCLGQPLARAELRIALDTLASRLPTLALAVPLEQVSRREDSIVYGLERLPVTW